MDLLQTLGLGDKPLEENVVCFSVYHDASDADLEVVRLEVLKSVLTFLKSHIWNRDAFDLESSLVRSPPWWKKKKRKNISRKSPSETKPSEACNCLWGTVRFGDNIEDEWVVVALLMRISELHPDLSIQVWDNDGDFMLIEAAYALPRWLSPEISANRVWIRGGHLQIIPQPSASSSNIPAFPSLGQALEIIRCPPDGVSPSAIGSKVEAAIRLRLKGLPESALSDVQRAQAKLPLRLAAALSVDPQLITFAVEAFCFRDSDDMRAAGRMTHFPPSEETCISSVSFNRCQYAMLCQQRYAPSRGTAMPSATLQPKEFQAAELGLKLTSGFEILWARAARVGGLPGQVDTSCLNEESSSKSGLPSGNMGSSLSVEQLSELPSWRAYKASLDKTGYFEGNILGSARYKELIAKAVVDFCQSPLLPRALEAVSDPVIRTLRALELAHDMAPGRIITPDWLACREALATGTSCDDSSDMDALQSRILDEELARRQAELEDYALKRKKGDTPQASNEDSEDPAKDQIIEAADLVGRISNFMSAMSGHTGAVLPESERSVALDATRLLSELRRTLGMPASSGPRNGDDSSENGGGSSSEGSSFFSDDEDDDSEDEEEGINDDTGMMSSSAFTKELERQMGMANTPEHHSAGRASAAFAASRKTADQRQTRHGSTNIHQDVDTATDSDDYGSHDGDEDDDKELLPAVDGDGHILSGGDFFDVYSGALEDQLRDTRMAESFDRMLAGSSSKGGDSKHAADGGTNGALEPVDLDMNLVRSLLKSVSAQQGLAGPAGNLAGLLGIDIPLGLDDKDI